MIKELHSQSNNKEVKEKSKKPLISNAGEKISEEKIDKNKRGIINEFANFNGNLEELLHFCNCSFLLNDVNQDTEKIEVKFYQDILGDVDIYDLKIIIDKLIKRVNTSMFGKDFTSEEKDEYLEYDKIYKIGERLLEGVVAYDDNQDLLKIIIKLYPYYTLGDNQPLIFTDLLKNVLSNHEKKVDNSTLVALIIDLSAHKDINTKTFNMHEDDYHDFYKIVFDDREADLDEYLAENLSIEKNSIEILKTMKFIAKIAKEKLEQGVHWDGIKNIYQYIEQCSNSDNFIVSEKAHVYIKMINYFIEVAEENSITTILWGDDKNQKHYLKIMSEFCGEDASNWSWRKIAEQLKSLSMEDRCKYYNMLLIRPQGIVASDMSTRMLRGSIKKSFHLVNNEISTPFSRELIGIHDLFGELLYSASRQNEELLQNESILDEFYLRQKKIDNSKNDLEMTDENYLFFEFSNIYFRNGVEKYFNISLTDLGLYEQKQFFYFLLNKTKKEVQAVGRFLNQQEDKDKKKYRSKDGSFHLDYELSKNRSKESYKISKINRIKSFLSMEHDSNMGNTILSIGEKLDNQPAIADKLFTYYAEMVDSAEGVAETIIQATKDSGVINKDRIISNLLSEAKELLARANESLEDKKTEKRFIADLEKINSEIVLLDQVIKQLPREQVAELDLRKIENIERMEEISAGELLEDKKLLEKIKTIIKAQFPDGDDVVFEEECRNNKNLRLTIAKANNEVLSFFSKEKVSKNVDYVDWFISNPDAPVKGLGEATLRLGFNKEDAISYYAVAKPHAKSFHVLIEKLGFISFMGSTVDGEYKDHYARIRKLPTDKNLESKNLTEAGLASLTNTIKTICLEEDKIEPYLYNGKRLKVCKVSFSGQTHEDDILESDEDGWIMAEIKKQYSKGNILTRFISESDSKDNQTFYAIFEKDNSEDNDKQEIEQVVVYKASDSKSHSDSKKVLSS